MRVHHTPEAAVRRGLVAILLAAGTITLLAPAVAANADIPRPPQDVYSSCIQAELERNPVHPDLNVIQTSCCAQAGGTPIFTQKGQFLTCDLPSGSSPSDGSGHQPNPPKPGSVVISSELPSRSRV